MKFEYAVAHIEYFGNHQILASSYFSDMPLKIDVDPEVLFPEVIGKRITKFWIENFYSTEKTAVPKMVKKHEY